MAGRRPRAGRHSSDDSEYDYCKLAICAIDYTDVEEEAEDTPVQLKSTTGGKIIPLGTIKIKS